MANIPTPKIKKIRLSWGGANGNSNPTLVAHLDFNGLEDDDKEKIVNDYFGIIQAVDPVSGKSYISEKNFYGSNFWFTRDTTNNKIKSDLQAQLPIGAVTDEVKQSMPEGIDNRVDTGAAVWKPGKKILISVKVALKEITTLNDNGIPTNQSAFERAVRSKGLSEVSMWSQQIVWITRGKDPQIEWETINSEFYGKSLVQGCVDTGLYPDNYLEYCYAKVGEKSSDIFYPTQKNEFSFYLDTLGKNNTKSNVTIDLYYKTALETQEKKLTDDFDLKNCPTSTLSGHAPSSNTIVSISADQVKQDFIKKGYSTNILTLTYKDNTSTNVYYDGSKLYLLDSFTNKILKSWNLGSSPIEKSVEITPKIFDQNLTLVMIRYWGGGENRYYFSKLWKIIPDTLSENDIYLISKNGSLKIRFDPKVTGLKYNIQDAIINTLGGAYPIIKRNGAQKYKTFNIEGLISMEVNDSFRDKTNLYTDVLYNDIPENTKYWLAEKDYRNQVLEFLHQDDVKLFKSFAEGNMLVRLSNISLTPKQELGRNLYSFSAQCTEVAEATYENTKKFLGEKIGGEAIVTDV